MIIINYYFSCNYYSNIAVIVAFIVYIYLDGHDDTECQSKFYLAQNFTFYHFIYTRVYLKKQTWIYWMFVICLLHTGLILRIWLDVDQAILRFILPFQLLEARSHSHRKESSPLTPFILREECNRRPYFPISTHWWCFSCKIMAP